MRDGGGLFIVLEGIDGAGTTTQARRLCELLEQSGKRCHLTREPSDGPIGKMLREILEGNHLPIDTITLGLLFAADRADHLQREIHPALETGAVVVCDRYYHSSLAYQGGKENREWIAELNQKARSPDCTFFLRVDPEVAARRRESDNRNQELFDHLETQRRVAKGYEDVLASLQADERIEILDGHLPSDKISSTIFATTISMCFSV